MRIIKKELIESIGAYPEFQRFDNPKDVIDLFVCAQGFEKRTTGVAKQLFNSKVRIRKSIKLLHSTNIEENRIFEDELDHYLNAISTSRTQYEINISEFAQKFRNDLKEIADSPKKISVMIDISSFSSCLILSIIKVTFEFQVKLQLVYSEAEKYHPLETEYDSILENASNMNSEFSQTEGISKVFVCPQYDGGAKEKSELIIAFPSFDAARTYSVLSYIDDLIIKEKKDERVYWLIGKPHLSPDAQNRRMAVQKSIHQIQSNSKVLEVSTFSYKETMTELDRIYQEHNMNFHISISNIGSKMQSIGISLYAMLKPNISVYYSEPTKYKINSYGEGIKDIWILSFEDTFNFIKELFQVDTFEIVP